MYTEIIDDHISSISEQEIDVSFREWQSGHPFFKWELRINDHFIFNKDRIISALLLCSWKFRKMSGGRKVSRVLKGQYWSTLHFSLHLSIPSLFSSFFPLGSSIILNSVSNRSGNLAYTQNTQDRFVFYFSTYQSFENKLAFQDWPVEARLSSQRLH